MDETPEQPDDAGAEPAAAEAAIEAMNGPITASYLIKLHFHRGQLGLGPLQQKLVEAFADFDPSISLAERVDR